MPVLQTLIGSHRATSPTHGISLHRGYRAEPGHADADLGGAGAQRPADLAAPGGDRLLHGGQQRPRPRRRVGHGRCDRRDRPLILNELLVGDAEVTVTAHDGLVTAPGESHGRTAHGILDIYVDTAVIYGNVRNDVFPDGFPSSYEPGLEDWTVDLDTNGNGQLDQGEPSTLTDAAGSYAFRGPFPAGYQVMRTPRACLRSSRGPRRPPAGCRRARRTYQYPRPR